MLRSKENAKRRTYGLVLSGAALFSSQTSSVSTGNVGVVSVELLPCMTNYCQSQQIQMYGNSSASVTAGFGGVSDLCVDMNCSPR
jgi:hypothetical protein